MDRESKPAIRAKVIATVRSSLRGLPGECDDDPRTAEVEAMRTGILQHYSTGLPSEPGPGQP
jgi:hypothetical protein